MRPNRIVATVSPWSSLGLSWPSRPFTRAQDPAPEAAPAKPAASGFLEPYPEFKKGRKTFDLVWLKEGTDFSALRQDHGGPGGVLLQG